MMRASEVVASYKTLASRLPIPPTLSEHMIRAAVIADTILDHWTGPAVDRDQIIAACLLHDIGNIVKIKFDTPEDFEWIGPDAKYWLMIKNETIARYGADADEVRNQLLHDLAELSVQECIRNATGSKAGKLLADNDFAAMLLLYADNRIAPDGIVTLAQRIEDITARYPGYYEAPHRKAVSYKENLHELERTLQSHTTIPLDSITDDTVLASPLWAKRVPHRH